jgi:arsenate reductase
MAAGAGFSVAGKVAIGHSHKLEAGQMDVVAPILVDEPIEPGSPGLSAALAAAGLPIDDLGQPGRVFFRFHESEETVGFGGYEPFGSDVLLRSIVVLPPCRGQGFGQDIVALLARRARDSGARRAFLLTTTARSFFERLGFRVIERASAPAAILATREASALCPATAPLMMKAL